MCSCWHFSLALKCLFYWAFPLLKVIPKRPLSREAPANKHISEGTGALIFTLDFGFPPSSPKTKTCHVPQAPLPHGFVELKSFMEQRRGAWWPPVAVLAVLCWAAPPESCWSAVLCSGDMGTISSVHFPCHMCAKTVSRGGWCSSCGIKGLPACSFLLSRFFQVY